MQRKHRGLPRYWRVRRLAGGKESYWHEPAARDRRDFPPLRLPFDKALVGTPREKAQALLDCEARNAELDAWRAGLAKPSGWPEGSFGALAELYRKSDRWRELAARTRQDYAKHLDTLAEVFGQVPVRGFTPQVVAKYRAQLTPGRQANYQLQVLSLVLGFAREIGEIAENPALRHRRFKLAKRDRFWSHEAERRFLEVASPPMRLALLLGLYTGQREADVLHMRWSDIHDGWLTIVQRKTGKTVSIPVASTLAAELAETRQKRRGIVILLGERGAPYTGNGFRVQFRRAVLKAGLDGLAFIDVRRSAVVRLAEAGCTVPEIASITGHTISETQRIIDTYWVATRRQARSAIDKLENQNR